MIYGISHSGRTVRADKWHLVGDPVLTAVLLIDMWGYALKDYRNAYPYLLSSDVHNAAVHVGGPALGAVCTESMTGDGTYDVIVLDFFMHVRQGLRVLAKRLRQRFPSALIIFVRRWHFGQIKYHIDNTTKIDAIDWIRRLHYPDAAFNDPRVLGAFAQTESSDWEFAPFTMQDHIIRETAESVNGHIVELSHPDTWNVTEAFISYGQLFNRKARRALSEEGHTNLTGLIQELVKRERVDDELEQARHQSGTWGSGDSCHMWYSTGVLPGYSYGKGVRMVKFAEQWGYKYALEFPPKGGYITVENPYNYPRMLYLTFMTIATSTDLYPRVQVYLGNRTASILEPMNAKFDQFSHTPRTVAVGLVPPGLTKVVLESLSPKKSRFRLTGASFLGSSEVPIEYTLELEPANDDF